jgi:hypothetical protein
MVLGVLVGAGFGAYYMRSHGPRVVQKAEVTLVETTEDGREGNLAGAGEIGKEEKVEEKQEHDPEERRDEAKAQKKISSKEKSEIAPKASMVCDGRIDAATNAPSGLFLFRDEWIFKINKRTKILR